MSALLKLMTLTICLNIFLYLGMNYSIYESNSKIEFSSFSIKGDLFDYLLTEGSSLGMANSIAEYKANLESEANISRSYSFEPNSNLSKPPPLAKATDSGKFSILDGLEMVMAFTVTLFNLAILPLTLMFNNVLPPLVGLIIGVPLMILNVTTIFMLIRGVGD